MTSTLLIGLAISGASAKADDLARLQENESRLKSEIANLNDVLTCKQDVECGYLEVGAKACGGPRSYLIYSKNNPQAADLKKKTVELTDNEKSLNQINKRMSTCIALLPPETVCVKNQCTQKTSPPPR